MAQRRVTVIAMVVGSIPTQVNQLFNFALAGRQSAAFNSLYTQYFENRNVQPFYYRNIFNKS